MVPAHMMGKNVRELFNPSTGMKLPVIATKGMVFSQWVPSQEEIDSIKNGHPVWVIMRGSYIPELTVHAGPESFVVPHDIRLESMTGNSDQKLMDEANAIVEQDMRNGKLIATAIVAVTVGLFLVGLYLGAKSVFS